MAMSTDIRDGRAVSRALFGNAAFIEVARATDRILANAGHDGTLTTRQVAAALGISDSVVRPVMLRLVAVGLLVALPKNSTGYGPQFFRRGHQVSWSSLTELVNDLVEVPPSLR